MLQQAGFTKVNVVADHPGSEALTSLSVPLEATGYGFCDTGACEVQV